MLLKYFSNYLEILSDVKQKALNSTDEIFLFKNFKIKKNHFKELKCDLIPSKKAQNLLFINGHPHLISSTSATNEMNFNAKA
jgi:hypothetical protein